LNPTALIYRSELLHPSETFIDAQAHALRRYTPIFAGLRRIHTGLDMDPEEVVSLTRSDSLRDKLHRRLFLNTGIGPNFLRHIAQHHPALIHAHFALDAAAALPIQKQFGLPLIATLHGYDATSTDDALSHTPAGRVFLRRREELFARAKFFICVSEHIRTEAIAHGFPAAKLRTLRIGVDVNLFSPDPMQSRSRDPIVLFVGRLVEKKGVSHLLRAMRLVSGRFPTAKLLLVGDGPLIEHLRTEARSTVRNCTFLGPQPPSVVRDLMRRAWVLAAPSIIAPSGDSEGLPIVLCEAQAIGLPVAAFAGPGINEAVIDGETALLAPSGDEPALAERIAAILADPDLATRLGQAGRKRALACFSLTRQTELLEQAYDEALQ